MSSGLVVPQLTVEIALHWETTEATQDKPGNALQHVQNNSTTHEAAATSHYIMIYFKTVMSGSHSMGPNKAPPYNTGSM